MEGGFAPKDVPAMNTTALPLLLVLVLSFYGCSKKPASHAKSHPAPQPTSQELPDELSQEAEIKAATPEDPGPIATVVSPLAIWTKNSQQSKQLSAASEPETYTSLPISQADHVDISQLPGPKNFLHKRFDLHTYADFPFTLPPHSLSPRLHGNFRSFAQDSPDSEGKSAEIELLLMNDQEFSSFVHRQPGDVSFAADPSTQQTVDFVLKSTLDQPKRYHLVFHNSSPNGRSLLVDANFTVSFE
jgi:hypothetical protein